MSKHLVEAMGGEMGVESCEGQGSTFWFSLPLDTSQATQSDKKTVALTTATLRVLIVDAQELHADLLAKQLRSWGMKEARAASSAQALEALEQALASGEPFQAVIVDWQLPQGEARSLAQAIHERRDLEDSAVVLMFNVGSNIDEADFEPIGIAGILTKPVRQSTLYNEIINAIAHKKNFSFTKPPSPDDQAIERSQWLQGKRVLLAEDNEINRIVASDMLQMLGCHCDLAWNGGEAVALTTTTVFDLILMDCQMPEMDGFEATQVIRENEKEEGGRRVPIIALTANAIEGDRQRCIEAGMDDYIAKPVDFDKLVETMTRVFSGHAEPSPVSPPLATVADQAHPIHVAEMLRLCRNNHRLVRTLLERFREQAETDLETLRNLVPAGDAQRVFEVAHGLKGAARMLSAERVAEAAQQLEQMGRAETLDHASEQLHMLEREIERCLAYLPEAIQHIS